MIKKIVFYVCFIFPCVVNTQIAKSPLNSSILTIGINGRAECGIVTDKTRDVSEDNEIAEAVMDKTGISELGTGFIYEYKNRKYIISCEHVLYRAGQIVGFDANYNEYELELVGSDMTYDVVVLGFKHEADEDKFNGLRLANHDQLNSTSSLSHFGFWKIDGTPNFKKGHILLNEQQDIESIPLTGMGYFESSAYVPGGYSGGPVINTENKVVGMNTARNIKGTSYALNSTILSRLTNNIINFGKVQRAFSGIEFAQLSDDGPVTIQSIIEGSPASSRYTDLIESTLVRINGYTINTIYDLLLIMEEIAPGDDFRLGLSDGTEVVLKMEYLNETNLSKISKHTLHRYSYPRLTSSEEIDNLIVVIEQGEKYIIRTAGIEGNKVYCLNTLSQLGVIIRMCALYGYIELGKDDSHIYIKEIKFSEDRSKRVLYY